MLFLLFFFFFLYCTRYIYVYIFRSEHNIYEHVSFFLLFLQARRARRPRCWDKSRVIFRARNNKIIRNDIVIKIKKVHNAYYYCFCLRMEGTFFFLNFILFHCFYDKKEKTKTLLYPTAITYYLRCDIRFLILLFLLAVRKLKI